LVEQLKFIAMYRSIGYQPLVRDLLNRFVRSELVDLAHEMNKTAEARVKESLELVPVRPALLLNLWKRLASVSRADWVTKGLESSPLHFRNIFWHFAMRKRLQ
jgi:hypothetical protein